jgi:hypothetical protein
MKIFVDRQKLNARAQAANIASIGGLLLLLASVLIPLFVPKWSTFTSVLMVLGAAGAMIGIYLANRWVRKPRPEESLDKALKAFDDNYRLYHYPASLPSEHILLTPTGVLSLEVVNLSGYFSRRNGRWKEAMTPGRALRYIVEERVSDPVVLSQAMVEELNSRLTKEFGDRLIVPVKALTVFTHPAAELEFDVAGVPACKIDKLRKQSTVPGPKLTPEVYEKLASYFERLTMPA